MKSIKRQTEIVGIKVPETGYSMNLGFLFPSKEMRDGDGIIPRGKAEFPNFAVQSFTTAAGLYKVEYYLFVKVRLSFLLLVNALTTHIGTSIRRQRY